MLAFMPNEQYVCNRGLEKDNPRWLLVLVVPTDRALGNERRPRRTKLRVVLCDHLYTSSRTLLKTTTLPAGDEIQ